MEGEGPPVFSLTCVATRTTGFFVIQPWPEFKTALLHFVWGMARDYVVGEGKASLDDLSVCVHLKGAEVRLMVPCHCPSGVGAGEAIEYRS